MNQSDTQVTIVTGKTGEPKQAKTADITKVGTHRWLRNHLIWAAANQQTVVIHPSSTVCGFPDISDL